MELGFVGTTTTEVTRRAGVSLGAMLHHFPTKADLLAAAVGHVMQRRQDEFRKAMTNVGRDMDRLDAAIDLMWEAFNGPTFHAWLELWVAARTDPELAEAVRSWRTVRPCQQRDRGSEVHTGRRVRRRWPGRAEVEVRSGTRGRRRDEREARETKT